jgi:RND family efflux transporter MFP subunit
VDQEWKERLAPPPDEGSTDSQDNKRNKIIKICAISLVSLALVAIIGTRIAGSGGEENKRDEVPLVSVAPATVRPVASTVSITGTIQARNELPLGSDEGGRVVAVYVEVGARVKRGERLATLDTSILGPQVDRLEASLAQAQAEAALAQADWDRAQGVEASGALSKEAIEQRRARLATSQAQVQAAAAQLAENRARLARTQIRAPADGIVLTRAAEVGQIVMPGGEPLFRLSQDGEVELRGQAAEQELPRLVVGQPATVRIAGVEKPFEGTVRLIGAVIDAQTRLGEVRIALAPDPNLRPGAFARGDVVVADMPRAVVPQTAVLADELGTYVLIVDGASKVQRQNVKIADTTPEGVVISDGLGGNEQVVTTAAAFLREGETIRIAEPQRAGNAGGAAVATAPSDDQAGAR